MTKEDILHHFQDINFYYNDCMMYDDLSRMLDELIAESKDEWIPVSERLPEKNTKVYLACCDDGYVTSIMYDSGRWLINGTNIIAWMPLPEPYKEKE